MGNSVDLYSFVVISFCTPFLFIRLTFFGCFAKQTGFTKKLGLEKICQAPELEL
jgi:hypothetical protein